MEGIIEALKQGIAPGIIIAAYLIIIKIIDSKKESKQAKISCEINECFKKLNIFLNHITEDILNDAEEKKNNAIKDSFKAFANSIIRFTTTIVIANNIEVNKQNIIDNIHNLVQSHYYELYNSMFLYKLHPFMNIEWKQEIINDLISIIYNNKLTKDEKLYNINNKVNIRTSNYISHVINNHNKSK